MVEVLRDTEIHRIDSLIESAREDKAYTEQSRENIISLLRVEKVAIIRFAEAIRADR